MKHSYCLALFLLLSSGCSEKESGVGDDRTSHSYSGARYTSEKLTFGVDTVAEHLNNPWGIAVLPNRRILVAERAGHILVVEDGQVLDDKIEIPEVYVHGQGGLMDIKLHPRYKDNGWIYLSYAKRGEGGGGTVIARTRLEGTTLVDFQELFSAEPLSESGVHFGSRIVFDGEGHILFSVGERGTKDNAQKLENHLGKIHRLHDDGRIPDDNPFVNTPGAKPEIWSYGHRNPQGLVFDRERKTLWAVEHGPRGGDELNRIGKGKNYGWPSITYGVNYDGTPITDKTEESGLEQPVTYWVPSIAPCGMTLVQSKRYAPWNGNLLIGALALKHIARVEVSGEKHVAQEKLLDQVARVRAIEESPDGYLYVVTEGPGLLLKLIPLKGENRQEVGD